MTATLIIDADGRVVALNDSAVRILGMCHGQPCYQAVGMEDGEGNSLCSAVCAQDLAGARSGVVEHRGWVHNRPARAECTRAGPHRICSLELLPLAPEAVAPLTPRQRQVLLLAAEGYTDVAMARICEVSQDTIRTHLQKARTKLNARSRTEAVARALIMGLLTPAMP